MFAAILAGGKSVRMGRDKAMLEYHGTPMIRRVLEAVSPSVERTIIISNNPGALKGIDTQIYADMIRGMGPLSGLVTAFDATSADEILLVACDMPMISSVMARFIVSCSSLPGDAVIPVVNGREQGLFAIYRRRSVEKMWDRISAASIQFDEFRKNLDRTFIPESKLRRIEPSLDSFHNVNRPEDLPPAR